jgi:hypothetical protein
MCKIGRWKTLLFGLALIALLASCAREGTVVVSFETANNESAWYPVDVVNWIVVQGNGGSVDYYPSYSDATADLQATLIDASTGQPSDSRVVHLDSYTVTWGNAHIPTLHGALDVLVPADPNSSKLAKFTVLVMPGIEKETLSVLADVEGDPNSDPNTFVGELVTTATIDFHGHDLASNDSVITSLHLTAAFADYIDPNSYH